MVGIDYNMRALRKNRRMYAKYSKMKAKWFLEVNRHKLTYNQLDVFSKIGCLKITVFLPA